jgi:hypothetical protein
MPTPHKPKKNSAGVGGESPAFFISVEDDVATNLFCVRSEVVMNFALRQATHCHKRSGGVCRMPFMDGSITTEVLSPLLR